MFGSLYFSEIRQYEPCELCWYQRILMYPFVVILGIATVKKDYKISLYSMVLSAIGGCISFYHYSMQKFSFIADISTRMRKSSLYRTIHQLVWIYHHSIFGTYCIYHHLCL